MIWQSDAMGELTVEWVTVYIAAYVIWLAYGFIMDLTSLKIFNSVAIVLSLVMLKPRIRVWWKAFGRVSD